MNNHQADGPKCVGFIMDGNRRYARQLGVDTLAGHMAGKDKLIEVLDWVAEANIPHVVVYAFSTENWQRSEGEVVALLQIFKMAITELQLRSEAGLVVRFIGRRDDFSQELQNEMKQIEGLIQAKAATVTLWIALSYGGRAEIVAAVNRAIAAGIEQTEASFSELLWTAKMPDPDLIIRTGGEERLSNFLPWQSVYSELFFSKTYWPAFTKEEFMGILKIYEARERRRGK